MSVLTRQVPCDGCTLCCRNDMIMLHPEMGDRPEDYLTERAVNPITGRMGLMVAKKPGTTDCVYLGEHGCTIHGRAPAICREFDCGKFYERFQEYPRHERRRMVRDNLVGKDVLEQGKRVQSVRSNSMEAL